MPITNIETTLDGYAAEWTYVPGEDVDFSEFTNISWLQIHAERDSSLSQQQQHPYTIPSIASLFPNLLYLRIQKTSLIRFGYRMRRTLGHPCFIGHLTDIPASVIDVIIEGTYITDLTTIFQHGPKIRIFKLIHNLTPISMPIIQLPRNLDRLLIEESAFLDTTQLIFPTTIRSIACIRCHMMRTRLENLENAQPNLHMIFEECTTQYNNLILNTHKYHPEITKQKVEHIIQVNAQHVYFEFGSIPQRINVSEKNMESPIVKAMFLGSNYPRRMAEFVASTKINTTFTLPVEWEIDEYDNDEDPDIVEEIFVNPEGELQNWSDEEYDEYDLEEDSMLEFTRMMG